MRNQTILNILVVGSMMLGVFAALVPTASAQQQGSMTVTVTATSDPIKPLRPPVSMPGQVSLTVDNTAYSGVIGVPVKYTVSKQPAWATVIVSPATDIIPPPSSPSPGTAYTATRSFTVFITTTDQAPAFTPDTVEITVDTTSSPGGKALQGKTSFPIAADYFSVIDASLQEAVKVDRPQTPVVFPLKITNFGNAQTKVTITPADHDPALQVAIPQPVILQSKQAGGSVISADVPLTIQTPYHNGYLNVVGQANYKITSAYALDSKIVGDSSAVSVVLTTRGFYVPGFEPALLFAALGGVAAIVAFRRRA
jgi:hypothetical protein